MAVAGPATAICERVVALLEPSDVRLVPAREASIAIVCLESVSRAELRSQGLLTPDQRAGHVQVLVAGQDPSPYGMRALMAMMNGVILTDDLDATLVPSLAAIAVGQRVFPEHFYAALSRPSLSVREKQVLAMVVLQCSNAEISQRLWLTESSVKNHLTSAFAKLGVTSRANATDLILDPETGLGLGILRITTAEETELGPPSRVATTPSR